MPASRADIEEGLKNLQDFASPPWLHHEDNDLNFEPYEILTATDNETLIRQLTHGKYSKVRVRGRDKPYHEWEYGIGLVSRDAERIAIVYKGVHGPDNAEILKLKSINLRQDAGRQLVEFDCHSVVEALHLYRDAHGDGDWSYFYRHPKEFERYISELPTYLKYYGKRNVIGELKQLVDGTDFYWEGRPESYDTDGSAESDASEDY